MIPLTLVCLALIALVAWREHGHRQQVNDLLTLRLEYPHVTPVPIPVDEPEEDGPLSEHEEIRRVVQGEAA